MANYTLTPMPVFGWTPAGGSRIYTYLSGTTTPATTYADAAGLVPNGAYVEADADGLFEPIYLPAQAFKFNFYLTGITPPSPAFATVDPVGAGAGTASLTTTVGQAGEDLALGDSCYLSQGLGSKVAGRWYKTDADFDYASINAERVGIAAAAILSLATGVIVLDGTATTSGAVTPGTVYYISASAGGVTATAPANARVVGIADTVGSIIIGPSAPWSELNVPVIQTTTSTGTVNDFALSRGPSVLLRCNNATTLTITGFATGIAGLQVTIVAVGAAEVVLANQSVSSVAENRTITGIAASLRLEAGVGRTTAIYDSTTQRWRALGSGVTQGTWTPVIGGSGGTSGQTYGLQQGNWTRDGNQVTAQFYAILTAKGTITTVVQIQGLPFTAAPGTWVNALFWSGTVGNWVNMAAAVVGGTKAAEVYGLSAAGTTFLAVTLTTADIANATNMAGTLSYMAGAT